MGFDLQALRDAVAGHGRVVRVVDRRGPRLLPARSQEPQCWSGTDGQSGTIGGGTLEFEAAEAAREQVVPKRFSSHALGPDLGQCCGGAVTLLSEVYEPRIWTRWTAKSSPARRPPRRCRCR